MPTETDLVGLGVAPQLAQTLGNQPNTLTCTGTTQGTAATVLTKNTELSASASQTGAVLQATAHVGSAFFFFCSSSTSAVVYCPSGQTLNGSSNGSLTIAQNKAAIIWQYKKGAWASILTA